MKKIGNVAKQKGFTLAELAIVSVIIAGLSAAVAYGFFGYRQNGNIGITKDFFIQKVPGAVATAINRRGSLTGVTKAMLVSYGLDSNTAWDDAWTVAGPTSGRLTFTYPLTSDSDAATTGADIVSSLTSSGIGHIVSATYASGSLTVVIQGQ
jgi:prepilin-type N-terminal cleavage/methylation domain-containing protein